MKFKVLEIVLKMALRVANGENEIIKIYSTAQK